MDLKSMTSELKAKALECKTPEDLLKLAKDEGVELSDEQLEAISGGSSWYCTNRDGDCSNFKPW